MKHFRIKRFGFKSAALAILAIVGVFAFFEIVQSARTQQQGGTERMVYDANGRLRAVIYGSGGVVTYEYDAVGNPTATRKSTVPSAILSFFPNEGIHGDQVTFVGVGFGATPQDNTVTFRNGVQARIISTDASQIVAEVPSGAVTGPLTIRTPAGTLTTDDPFYIIPAVEVAPTPAAVELGTRKQFTEIVRLRSGDRTVAWSLRGVQPGPGGLLQQNGIYIAPTTLPPASVTIRATSMARPELFGDAEVVLGKVVVTPAEAILQPGETMRFAAQVALLSGDQRVVWEVNGIPGGDGTVGRISVQGDYTSPAVLPSVPIVIRATSVAVPQFHAESRVGLGRIEINPAETVVAPGENRQFTATVPSTFGNRAVAWSVNSQVGGGLAFGTISTGGVYTAPEFVPNEQITIRATSIGAPALFGESRLIVGKIDIFPRQVGVSFGRQRQFSALVQLSGGNPTDVVWSVNSVVGGNPTFGRINQSGTYTAPFELPPGPVVVRAASVVAPSLFAEAEVVVGGVSVNPQTVILGPLQSQRFTAGVTITSENKRVRWSIVEGEGADYGTVNSDGTFFAPASPGIPFVTIRATSEAVPDLFGEARVRLLGSIQIVPQSVTLGPGQSAQFTAMVLPQSFPPERIVWSVSSSGGNPGSIAGGLYIAPSIPPSGPVIVRAASADVPSVVGTAQVNFINISVQVNPSSASVAPNGTQQFTATVFPLTANQAVTWSVVSGGGSITSSGLFTAPSTDGVTVTIRATSVASPSAFGTATVVVTDPGQSRSKQ